MAEPGYSEPNIAWEELSDEELRAFCAEDLPTVGDDIEARLRHVEAAANALCGEELPVQARREIGEYVAHAGLRVERLEELGYAPRHNIDPWAAASCDSQARRIIVHDPFFLEGAHRRFMVAAHELGHLNSVFDTKNAWMFGGEEAQARAASTVRQITRQCELTGMYLDPYHKKCVVGHRAGSSNMTREGLDEETWAILCSFVSTGRLEELAVVTDKQAAVYSGEGFVHLKMDEQMLNVFSELFTGGLLYGVHDGAAMQKYANQQRAFWEALQSCEANEDIYPPSLVMRIQAINSTKL